MIGDWKIHGLDADIDIRCMVLLPDGRPLEVPVTVNAEGGRFYFEPDQDVVLDAIRGYWQMVSDRGLYGFSVSEAGRRVDPSDIRPPRPSADSGQVAQPPQRPDPFGLQSISPATAVPPGVCVTHGAYSGSCCPRCSTAVVT